MVVYVFPKNGVTLRASGIGNVKNARRSARETLGYVEVHIEQGPVLEAKKMALGVVGAIAGQTRATVEFVGRAAHAGTTPMELRQDALTAAAEFISAVERTATGGLRATVGQLVVHPGVSNVVPGATTLSLDVRHQSDARRQASCKLLRDRARQIAHRRGIRCTWQTVQQTSTVRCDRDLTALCRRAVNKVQPVTMIMPSGAGHDAAAMASLCPVSMLFLRCKKGISHHPEEAVKLVDVGVAISALCHFLRSLASRYE